MMQDFVRTATYHRAILQNHSDFRDKVMLGTDNASHPAFRILIKIRIQVRLW